MDFGLDAEQRLLQSAVRELLAARCAPRDVAATPTGWDRTLWLELNQLGLPGVLIPAEYGGAGLGMLEAAVLFEELGRALHPGPALDTTLAAVALSASDDEAQRERWLPRLAAGELTVGLAFLSSAEREVVVGFGGSTDLLLVADGGEAFLVDRNACSRHEPVPMTDPLYRAERISIEGVAAEPIGGDTACIASAARVLQAADLVGSGAGALELTVNYVKQRVQFDRPIGSFQAVKPHCADMLLQVENARAATYYAAWAEAAGAEDALVAGRLARAYAAEWMPRVGARAIQLHGGLGFTWDADPHLYYKRALRTAHQLGEAAHDWHRIADTTFGEEP